MNRCQFITLLGGAASTWPLTALSQRNTPRLGLLLDRITNSISNGQPSHALYKALGRRSVSTGVPRDFVVSSFLSFSTISAPSAHSAHLDINQFSKVFKYANTSSICPVSS
jgi:hypothetical protein